VAPVQGDEQGGLATLREHEARRWDGTQPKTEGHETRRTPEWAGMQGLEASRGRSGEVTDACEERSRELTGLQKLSDVRGATLTWMPGRKPA
jgi:hypothetical protein